MHRIFRCWTFAKEDCWSLFVKHALGDTDPDEESNLKRIGKVTVKKCNGLPLAIKTLASMLHSEDLPYHKSDILPALRLSYHYLPSQLKHCFAYCSIFLKGHKFEKGDLIRMWVTEDLVQQLNSRRRMEDAGEQYFHELLSRSIFQQSHLDQTRFEMHDFVNDLAQHIAGEFCSSSRMIVLRTFYLDHQVRAILVSTLESLENLFPSPSHLHLSRCLRITRLPTDMKDLTKLKHLDLKGTPLLELLDSIGDLKQLGYLDLLGTEIHCLPEEICSCIIYKH
ncbi:hypothetical protein ERO13_D10G188766v2 [Gossypium hirsutum]|nr:hypothetical protein ERO13_D10G188766v2 [Gossypium hirsutum]